MSQELLFNKFQIFGVVQGQTEAVKKRVQVIPPNTLLNASEHDLVQALVEEFRLNVPVIKDEDIYVAHSGEAQVDVSRDPMRMIFDRSQPFYVAGSQTVIAVPFDGDPDFFRVQPQTHSLSPPRAEVGNGELLLTYVRTDQNAEAIKREYLQTVNSVVRLPTRATTMYTAQACVEFPDLGPALPPCPEALVRLHFSSYSV
jgi:hypothetical protein